MSKTKSCRLIASMYYISICFFAFLAGFNLFGFRGVYFSAIFALSFIRLFLSKQQFISPASICISVFTLVIALSYCRFASFSFIQILLIGVLPIFAFVIGQKGDDGKEIKRVIIAASLGYAFTTIINIYFSLSKGAVIGETGLDFYYDAQLQAKSPRPFAAIGFILCMALGATFLFTASKTKWFATVPLGLVFVLGPLAINAFVGNRSPFFVTPLLLFALFFYFAIKNASKRKRTTAWCFLSLFVVAFASLYLFYYFNLLGFRDLVSKIPAIYRFIDSTGSGRKHHYEVFFEEWLNYPFGGMFVANLFVDYGVVNQIHNTFLQVYSIGGWIPFVLEVILLVFLVYQFFSIKIQERNRFGVTLSLSLSIAFFAICLLEPMITSEPFICSLFFLCAGYLYGEWARQRNRKPLFFIGLSHNGGPILSRGELLGKAAVVLVLVAAATVLTVFSDYGSVFSVISLLLLVSGFAVLDKADYSVFSIIKTILCLVLSASFAIFLNIYLPTNTWMYALAKSVLSIAVFILSRIVVVSKKEEKDGYYRLRNFFTKLARDIDGSPEENLVSQDLQAKGE